MEKNNFGGVIESLMKGMEGVLSSHTVVGEPTKVGDTLIIPLVDVSFGVGAGAAGQDKKDSGSGGFGAKMSPSAVLIIKGGQTKLVNVKNQDTVTKLLDLVPEVMDRFSSKSRLMDDDDALDIAFPDRGVDGETDGAA